MKKNITTILSIIIVLLLGVIIFIGFKLRLKTQSNPEQQTVIIPTTQNVSKINENNALFVNDKENSIESNPKNQIQPSANVAQQLQPVINYSDYILNYTVTKNPNCGNNEYYNFLATSNRDIVIKKIVVQSLKNSYVDTVWYGFQQSSNSSNNTGFLTKASNNIWTVSREIPIIKSDIPVTFNFNDSGKNCGISNVTPLFDQWVVWDNTSNLPVKIIRN